MATWSGLWKKNAELTGTCQAFKADNPAAEPREARLVMKASLSELLARIPGSPSPQSPAAERFAQGFSHGSMSVGLYAPLATDPQQPHKRDELYIIQAGTGELVIAGVRHAFVAGDAFLVGSGVEHRFENFSAGFPTWVIFWGPAGGES
jgi:mannose-6-phosphate isomerase-like protein (cupin superfamily)